jgi:hypothetical protein
MPHSGHINQRQPTSALCHKQTGLLRCYADAALCTSMDRAGRLGESELGT